MMRYLIVLILCIGGLSAASLAEASHSMGQSLSVENTFDGAVKVYAGGQMLGVVGGNSRRLFSVYPGNQLIRASYDGKVLFSKNLWVSSARMTSVRVVAPKSTLRVVNKTSVPLKIDIAQGADGWVQPYSTRAFSVLSGSVGLSASVPNGMGGQTVEKKKVWVSPGKVATTSIRHGDIAMRQLTVTNKNAKTVRVYINGVERGVIRPGKSQVFLSPNTQARVMVRQVGGSILFNSQLNMNMQTRLTLDGYGHAHLHRGAQIGYPWAANALFALGHLF